MRSGSPSAADYKSTGDRTPKNAVRRQKQEKRVTNRFKTRPETLVALALLGAAIASVMGCTSKVTAIGTSPPPEVEVAAVQQRNIPIEREWIGTLDGLVNAAIKAEVTGYLLSQSYTEGSFVRKGQLLFEIDPRPFNAALAQAQGQLAQAKGQLAQAHAQLIQAQAQLAQSVANQQRIQLDVKNTRRSPNDTQSLNKISTTPCRTITARRRRWKQGGRVSKRPERRLRRAMRRWNPLRLR